MPIAITEHLFLQYCNELSMSIELDSTLAQAEVLFLSFSQLVADFDRREAEENSSRSAGLRNRRTGGAISSSADGTPQTRRPVISEELRELLRAGE